MAEGGFLAYFIAWFLFSCASMHTIITFLVLLWGTILGHRTRVPSWALTAHSFLSYVWKHCIYYYETQAHA